MNVAVNKYCSYLSSLILLLLLSLLLLPLSLLLFLPPPLLLYRRAERVTHKTWTHAMAAATTGLLGKRRKLISPSSLALLSASSLLRRSRSALLSLGGCRILTSKTMGCAPTNFKGSSPRVGAVMVARSYAGARTTCKATHGGNTAGFCPELTIVLLTPYNAPLC